MLCYERAGAGRVGSKKERMGDALALGDDEGRGKLRKATGRCKQSLIRRCPNGGTCYVEDIVTVRSVTQGTETSKYLEEEKIINDSASSGERTRKSPNQFDTSDWGCRTEIWCIPVSGTCLENAATEGDSPVHEVVYAPIRILSSAGPEKSCVNLPAPSGKAKYSRETDSEPVL